MVFYERRVVRIYKSFLIRCWLLEDSQNGEREVYDLQSLQSGERARSANLNQVNRWIRETCRSARPERDRAVNEE